jgi:hypothetical protein
MLTISEGLLLLLHLDAILIILYWKLTCLRPVLMMVTCIGYILAPDRPSAEHDIHVHSISVQ